MSSYASEGRNRVKRVPERGYYDKDIVYGIIDDAIVCHLGFIQDSQPFVIPTLHVRKDDELLVHGASTNRLLQHLRAGHDVCVSMTILDGIVVAKTVFNQSVNYRSVVLFGKGRSIEDEVEKRQTLAYLTERLMPGVWDTARKPTASELKATSVVAIAIESASAKVRSGPPGDDIEDQDLLVWAGVLPVMQAIGPAISAEYANTPLPDYITQRNRSRLQG